MTATHRQLVLKGANWLNKKAPSVLYRSQFVLTEFSSQGTNEIPDIFGIRPYGNILIEVKVSRSDFLRDRYKKGRIMDKDNLAAFRFYLVPTGVIKPIDVPPKWGLLVYNEEYDTIEMALIPERFKEDYKASNYIYYSVLRRLVKPSVLTFRKDVGIPAES